MMHKIHENAGSVLQIAGEVIEARQDKSLLYADRVELLGNARSVLDEMREMIKQLKKIQPEAVEVTAPLLNIAMAALELAKSPEPIDAEQAMQRTAGKGKG